MFSLKFRSILAASAASLILAGAAPALASHDDDDRGRDDRSGQRDDSRSSSSSSSKTTVRLSARMAKDGVIAKAVYEARIRRGGTEPKFTVELRNAVPGKKFEVFIQGVSFGSITANKFGDGKLELRRSPSGPNERPIPANFPELKPGHVVTVGEMSAALR